MRGVGVIRAVACGVLGVAVLAACTGGSEESAGPTTTIRDLDKIEVFNPCRGDLSDTALREAGLDPATKVVVTDPPSGVSAWRVCSWTPLGDRSTSGQYRLAVFSTSHTLDDAKKKEGVTGLQDTQVNARPGLVFREQADPDTCYVSFEAGQGMFEVAAAWLSTEGPRVGDLCGIAADHAAALEPNLPK